SIFTISWSGRACSWASTCRASVSTRGMSKTRFRSCRRSKRPCTRWRPRRRNMDFKLPELGEGVYEAEMSRWLVKEGDTVKPGQGLLEVLTDKATMEVPVPFAGTIDSLKVGEGDKLKIGQVIVSYTPKGAKSGSATPAAVTKAPAVAAQAR